MNWSSFHSTDSKEKLLILPSLRISSSNSGKIRSKDAVGKYSRFSKPERSFSILNPIVIRAEVLKATWSLDKITHDMLLIIMTLRKLAFLGSIMQAKWACHTPEAIIIAVHWLSKSSLKRSVTTEIQEV